jgi:hypothetical protein
MRWWAIGVLCYLCHAPELWSQTPEEWLTAVRMIRRLPPDSFPELPKPIRAVLAARGCEVPQSYTRRQPHNVVTGHFARPDQKDWAVLCSHLDTSAILIFWGDPRESEPTEIARSADVGFLQGIGPGRIGYSRILAVASPAQIREYAAAFGGPLPAALDHDGVEDAFAEKASNVAYFEGGRWRLLGGAD